MSLYKHILVASNLGELDQKVSDRAKQVAEKSNAKLSMVHVIEFNPMMYGGGEFAIPLDGDLEESVHNHAAKALTTEGQRLGISEDNQFLQSGATSESLVELVNTIKADLLVLGHHEHHWLGSFLGSTSNSLVHQMPCDVLTVPIS